MVGNNIRSARKAQGLTLREVGEALGLEPANVARWERGAHTPSAKYLVPLASLLFDGEIASLYREKETA